MLTKRIIPCLDVKNVRVVKGVNFVGLRDAGDPVECAKQYMLKNPVATLEDVAQYSGFNDSASLCHKFKDVTGMSPKVWLVSNTAN